MYMRVACACIQTSIPGLHTASLIVVPSFFTVVSAQALCLAHSVLLSSLALNVPVAQASHFAGSPLLAATNFLPAAHLVTGINTTHGDGAIVVVVVVVVVQYVCVCAGKGREAATAFRTIWDIATTEHTAEKVRTRSCTGSERHMYMRVACACIQTSIPGLHTASLIVVPSFFTVVSAQALCLAHSVLLSSLALNVPVAQASHFAGSPLLAATNFLPAAHLVTGTNTTHGDGAIVVVVVWWWW